MENTPTPPLGTVVMAHPEYLKQAAEAVVTSGVVQTAITKGVHTSEFKMAAIGLGIALATGLGTALSVIPGPWSILGAGILGGLSVFGYGVSRGLAKSNAVPVTNVTPTLTR